MRRALDTAPWGMGMRSPQPRLCSPGEGQRTLQNLPYVTWNRGSWTGRHWRSQGYSEIPYTTSSWSEEEVGLTWLLQGVGWESCRTSRGSGAPPPSASCTVTAGAGCESLGRCLNSEHPGQPVSRRVVVFSFSGWK